MKRGGGFEVYKLTSNGENTNCIDAIDNFELQFEMGNFSFLPGCENAQITAIPQLNQDDQLYQFKIGLTPQFRADYVINWVIRASTSIQNTERNESIALNYPLQNHPNQLGFNQCGNVSWLFLEDASQAYFFTVE